MGWSSPTGWNGQGWSRAAVSGGGGGGGTLLSATAHSPGAVLDSDKLGFSAPSTASTTATIDVGVSTGKHTFEFQVFNTTDGGLGGIRVGIADASWVAANISTDGDSTFLFYTVFDSSLTFIGPVGPGMSDGEWASVMWDADTGEITVRTTELSSGPHALGGAIGYSAPYFPVLRSGASTQATSLKVNFGGSAWHYDDSAAGFTVGF